MPSYLCTKHTCKQINKHTVFIASWLLHFLFIAGPWPVCTELYLSFLFILFLPPYRGTYSISEVKARSERSTRRRIWASISPRLINMMWMGHDEVHLKCVIGLVVWGVACVMASCNLSVDTLPRVPKKPITPLSEAFLQLNVPFIRATCGWWKTLFTI